MTTNTTSSSQGRVFIGVSLDGFIADKNGSLDWLESINQPFIEKGETPPDRGYSDFMKEIGVYLMGRSTFDFVYNATKGQAWPIAVPVVVLSTHSLPEDVAENVSQFNGSIEDAMTRARALIVDENKPHVYVDGGKVIRQALEANEINSIHMTVVPMLLGEGSSLFSGLKKQINLELIETKTLDAGIISLKYFVK